MKIQTGSTGNYSLNNIRNEKRKIDLQHEEQLNNEEKKFFISKYPDNRNEILEYHFYEKSGKMQGLKLGSLFDKKG
jgi:hypothetical protein